MPTLHREGGLRFVIYLDDHPPPHVHVEGKDGRAKVAIDGARVIWARGLSRADRKLVLDVVNAHSEAFLRAWKSIHG